MDLQGGGNNKVSAFSMGYPRTSLYMNRPFQVNLNPAAPMLSLSLGGIRPPASPHFAAIRHSGYPDRFVALASTPRGLPDPTCCRASYRTGCRSCIQSILSDNWAAPLHESAREEVDVQELPECQARIELRQLRDLEIDDTNLCPPEEANPATERLNSFPSVPHLDK